MKKFIAQIIFACSLFSAYFTHNDVYAASKQRYSSAPVENILDKQRYIGQEQRQKYQKSIIRSYALLPNELNEMLQKEYRSVNRETERMRQIKKNWNKYSDAYRLANYKLYEQISTEITQSRKRYVARKKRFDELLQAAPIGSSIYIIEATDPLFFYFSLYENSNRPKMTVQMSFSHHGIRYLSVFDHKYKHLFTYHRQHVDMLQTRRFKVAQTRNVRVNQSYQKIFDDYITDLKKIGAGVDITNKDLLTKLSEMKDEYHSE